MQPDANTWIFELMDAAAYISEAATSPIISLEESGPQPLGMGTFLQVEETKVLITAAHVIEESLSHSWPLAVLQGVPDDRPGKAIPLVGYSWRINREPYDLAVLELGDATIDQLAQHRFIGLEKTSMGDVHSGVFCFFGFPRDSLERSVGDSTRWLGPFSYGANLYSGGTATFKDYSPEHHILIQRSELGGIDRKGGFAAVHDDPRGISGCPLFQIGRDGKARSEWTPDRIRIVGVATGFHREAFVATRWDYVNDMLWFIFPKLRSALKRYGFNPPESTVDGDCGSNRFS
jgi:hypothetical protein